MKETGEISAAAQIAALILILLVTKSFNYNLVSVPVGNMLKSSDLYSMYKIVFNIASQENIKIISLVGDGDSRLGALQRIQYKLFPHKYKWVKSIEFPFVFGLGKDYADIPMQDMLHFLKKLRNNLKYLSTKLLLFCDPECLNENNRLKFCANWECILRLRH